MSIMDDFIIRVNRLESPQEPKWGRFEYPELQSAGPAEYDLRGLELWLHDDQKNGAIKGKPIYEHLKKTERLQSCLSLLDALAIREKRGLGLLRGYFPKGAVLPFWLSVAAEKDGDLRVPCLVLREGGSVQYWRYLNDPHFVDSDPTLRFPA